MATDMPPVRSTHPQCLTPSSHNQANITQSTESPTSVSPAEIAGIAVSSVAILFFAAIIIYLCGRHGGFNEAARRGLCNISSHHPYTAKLKDGPEDGKDGKTSPWKTFFTREKPKNKTKPQMSIVSPLQIQNHLGNNPHADTLEFQAAVQNLLGYTPQDVQEWYPYVITRS